MKSLKNTPGVEFGLVLMSEDIHYREVLDLEINIHFILRKTKKDLSVLFRFYDYCKQFRPDIVHCWDSMTAVYSFPICKLLRIKFINGMVTNSPQKRKFFNKHWLRARLTFPFSDLIIANSKAGLQAYSAPKKKSVVIYNGFDFNRLDNIQKKDPVKEQLNAGEKYVIGMVATFSGNKDYNTFFTAACSLLNRRKDMIFLAIGNQTDSVDSIKLIGKQYFEFFRLLGRRTGVESYINAMDICVLSTFSEGISNSILEYMALGKPVIATSGGGTGELVLDNTTGYLIRQSDPEELAEKMELLLNDPELRTRMGLEGRSRIRNEFLIEKMVREYYDIYNKISFN